MSMNGNGNVMKVGIEAISFYTPKQYMDLTLLAKQRGVDPDKYVLGIGQEKIGVPAHDEDVVTMGAEAAYPIINDHGTDGIDTLLFATETSIDQSKSAGIYVHRLLDLPKNCRNVEMKQACYSSTAALQMACGYVARKPGRKVLVIASDISRYDLDTPGEATQGAGAVAMLISSDPKIMEITELSGCYTEDVMDFWRPNYRKTPFVDGKFSALKYLHALKHTWNDYRSNDGLNFSEFVQFCYHLPFTRMAEKAHKHLASLNETELNRDHILPGMVYNRQIGNSYSASIYISLISMLDNFEGDLSTKPIAMFSYGSGASAEFFSGIIQDGYKEHLNTQRHETMLNDRVSLSYDDYIKFWNAPDPQDGSKIIVKQSTKGRYKLKAINDHKRHYESVA